VIPAVGLGAGGHASVVIEILRAAGTHDPVALLDPREELWGSEVLGVPVVGGDELLQAQYDSGVRSAFIGLGGSGDLRPRQRLYERALSAGLAPVDAIHPTAVVSPSAVVGPGVTIAPFAIVHARARLGCNVLVNTAAVVEHDCVLGDHVHVASGATLASTVTVGAGAHVGLGAAVRQGTTVGSRAVVGAGAVVVADVESGTVVVGNPARVLRRESP
jgi:UDP-perosamine 4-acetyltransferase